MARAARKSSGGGKASKPARAPKKAAKAKAEVTMVDDEGVEIVKKGLTLDDGIVIGAGLVTLGAWVMMMMAGQDYAPPGP